MRRFQSDGGGCSAGYYGFVDEDLRYVHEDYRDTVFAVQAKAADGGPRGLPGLDGKIGTTDDLPYLDPETFGRNENYRDPEFLNLADSQVAELAISLAVDRSTQAVGNLFTLAGMTSYGGSPVGFGESSSVGSGSWSMPGGFGLVSLSGSSGVRTEITRPASAPAPSAVS